MVDDMTAGSAASTITEPLPSRGAENNASWIMYTAIGAGV